MDVIAYVKSSRSIQDFHSEYDQISDISDDISDIEQLMNMVNNTDIILSDAFIVIIAETFDWDMLTRPLSERLIERYHKKIKNWTAQMYSTTIRTIDFIIEYKNNIDWKTISKNPPKWFNECHAEIIDTKLDWHALTPVAIAFSKNLLLMHVDDLDWTWISRNHMIDEEFAVRFIQHILWDDSQLNTMWLSTEFLYEIDVARRVEYCSRNGLDSAIVHNRFALLMMDINLDDYVLTKKIRIGGSISLMFFRKHFDDIDISKLMQLEMITEDMQLVIDNM